jgi:hypothetical protein
MLPAQNKLKKWRTVLYYLKPRAAPSPSLAAAKKDGHYQLKG